MCACDTGYGGDDCNTFLDRSALFPETQIVTPEWGALLNGWAKQPAGQKWALCYSSDTMDKTATEFHKRCDQYTPTVTVAHNSLGTALFRLIFRALSGSISTVSSGLSWICVGIHRRRALPCPVCA